MSWQAKSGCAKHHRAAVERMVNAFPPSYLLPPCSGEIFENLDECTSRLRGYSVAEGFDVVRQGGGTKKVPGCRYKCIFHGTDTRNYRKLEDFVKKDFKGKIISNR
jgi:hypothetical protein